jgi:hypothetical protein
MILKRRSKGISRQTKNQEQRICPCPMKKRRIKENIFDNPESLLSIV